MKPRFFLLALAIALVSTIGPTKLKAQTNEQKAEEFFQKTMAILINTTSNALSKSLAQEAMGYINQAIELSPNHSSYYRAKGAAFYHLKLMDSALANKDLALRLDSTNSAAWMGRGIILENTFKYEAAALSYLQALKYDSTSSSSIYYNLGILFDRMGDDSMSLTCYEASIALNPKAAASAYTGKGMLHLRAKRYALAIEDFSKTLSLNPNDKIGYNNRGLCKFYLKQYEAAIADFEQAMTIKLGASFNENFDTDKYSLNNIANAYHGMGNKEKACDYWKKTIEAGYKYQKEWKKLYNIDDPAELVKKYCR
jgi:tetratricopeptide (TPR) repeat protein